MSYENLTREQQDLLRWIVRISKRSPHSRIYAIEDTIRPSLVIVYTSDGEEFPDPLEMNLLKSLDASNLIGLGKSSKIHRTVKLSIVLRQLAFEAVQNKFTPPKQITKVDTGGGAYVEGDVRTDGGDFIGRDKNSER